MEEEPEGDLIDLATEDQKKIRQVLKQNLGRPKGRHPVGILQRLKKIGYQLHQKQGKHSDRQVIQSDRKTSVPVNRTV